MAQGKLKVVFFEKAIFLSSQIYGIIGTSDLFLFPSIHSV